MNTGRIIRIVIGVALLGTAAVAFFMWNFCRVYVPPDKCLVLIRKTGKDLGPGQVIAEAGQKGIQRETLGPGRYFFNPWAWDTELHPLITVSAGDPATWQEIIRDSKPDYKIPKLEGKWPEVGIVVNRVGKSAPNGSEVVDEGYQGIQKNVLTPGAYRLNPYMYEVKTVPAIAVPLGCIGVVTSQLGDMPGVQTVEETSIGPDGQPVKGPSKIVQKLAEPGQRGVVKNVLQPGLYYLNPYVHKVKIIWVGYNLLSQVRGADQSASIEFPSKDGFTIDLDVTVVWGLHPAFTPELINRMGEVERIRQLILNHVRSICRNVGSNYQSTDFIHGEKRELYQKAVTEGLQTACREKDIEILIALIQNIEVHGGSAVKGEMDLKKTIQAGYVAKEQELTKKVQSETAKVKAALETAKSNVPITREKISADTRLKVAGLKADGQKKAAETDAQRELEVAKIEQQIAELSAQNRLALGQAEAEVEKLRNQAEADGKTMMVKAFGSGRAYNLYTFSENFAPESIRLIFAGEGTFWTDLSKMQDAAAMKLLQPANEEKPPAKKK